MNHRNTGFTLTELMVVVAISGMVAVAAAPSVISRVPNHRLNRANWQVYMDLNEAKSRAVSENREIVVNVNTSTKTYTFWSDANDNDVRDTGEVVSRTLSEFHKISMSAYPSQFIFNQDGTMESGYYYAYIQLLEPTAGNKIIYAFPNGSIHGYQAQTM
jgi:type II secretion system protein H